MSKLQYNILKIILGSDIIIKDSTKKWSAVEYLGSKGEPVNYIEMTKDLKALKPDIFPPNYTSKNMASILSSELTRNPKTPFERVKTGYYTVKKPYKKKP